MPLSFSGCVLSGGLIVQLPALLDVQTVTTGASGTIPSQNRVRGWSSTGPVGAINDGTSNIYSGATIANLFWSEDGLGGAYYYLAIVGATNTGWDTLTIQSSAGTATLLRTAASFGVGANWTWTTTDIAINQAFGAEGTVVTCTFT